MQIQFGGTAADVAEDADGRRVPHATGTVWDGEGEGATQLVVVDEYGSPMTELRADVDGMLPTFYIEDGPERVHVDFGAGRVALVAVDVGDRLRQHQGQEDAHGDRAWTTDHLAGLMGVPGGLATLDAAGLVPAAQLPAAQAAETQLVAELDQAGPVLFEGTATLAGGRLVRAVLRLDAEER
ncbi:hypothetical protein [Streptomyces buecherae]|uniref:hypothetical protein n=1 Tax=Streptomyces buecherae TaxID=2763006 RepID=UPI0037A87017